MQTRGSVQGRPIIRKAEMLRTIFLFAFLFISFDDAIFFLGVLLWMVVLLGLSFPADSSGVKWISGNFRLQGFVGSSGEHPYRLIIVYLRLFIKVFPALHE
jgi:hypothetical protein